MFLHLSVILFTGGGSLGPGPGEVGGSAQGGVKAQAHVFTPVCHSVHRGGLGPGGEVGGLPWGSRPRPRGVCVYPSMHWGRPPPPSRWLLLRTVRILLECILVLHLCLKIFTTVQHFCNAKFLLIFKLYCATYEKDAIDNLSLCLTRL